MQRFLFINKATLLKLRKLLKWGLIGTKLAAICTAVTGAVTAITSSLSTGFAMTAAGATTYAAAKNLPGQGYDKTKHIPPVASAAKPPFTPNRQEQLLLVKKKRQSSVDSSIAANASTKAQTTRMASRTTLSRKRP